MAKMSKPPRSDRGKSHRTTPENSARAAARIARVRPVDLVLRCKHTVQGVVYGPGPVRVRKDLADLLMETERNALAADASFFGTKAAIIGARNRVIPVPPEMFNEYYNNAAPSHRLDGRDWAGQAVPAGGMPV